LIKQKSRSTLAENRKSNRLASSLNPLRQSPRVTLFSLKCLRAYQSWEDFDLYLSVKIARRKEAVKFDFNFIFLRSDERYQPKDFYGKLARS